jgi:exodeoxyribonuclease VIII
LSPDKYKEESTEAMILGNALHTYVLERKEFDDRYFIEHKVNKRTKEGKLIYKEMQGNIGYRQTISTEMYQQITSMADALYRDPLICGFIESAKYEKSIFWIDPDTQILCKCRPDIWHVNMICDLKTASDASPKAFERSIIYYGYHIQAAMIQEALMHVCHQKINDFIFIAVEKKRPFATAMYPLSQEKLKQGLQEFKTILQKYKQCLDENQWPSYEIREL